MFCLESLSQFLIKCPCQSITSKCMHFTCGSVACLTKFQLDSLSWSCMHTLFWPRNSCTRERKQFLHKFAASIAWRARLTGLAELVVASRCMGRENSALHGTMQCLPFSKFRRASGCEWSRSSYICLADPAHHLVRSSEGLKDLHGTGSSIYRFYCRRSWSWIPGPSNLS